MYDDEAVAAHATHHTSSGVMVFLSDPGQLTHTRNVILWTLDTLDTHTRTHTCSFFHCLLSLLSGSSSAWAATASGDQVPRGRLPSGCASSGSDASEARKCRMRHASTPDRVARCSTEGICEHGGMGGQFQGARGRCVCEVHVRDTQSGTRRVRVSLDVPGPGFVQVL